MATPVARPTPGARPTLGARVAPVLRVLTNADLMAHILLSIEVWDPVNLSALVAARWIRDAVWVDARRRIEPLRRTLEWAHKVAKGRAIFEGRTDYIYSCAFSPDGKRIATASSDGTARLWDAETGALLATLDEGHGYCLYSTAFSPDGTRVVTASGGDESDDEDDGATQLWDAETGALLTLLEGHTGIVWSCAFSPDGNRVVTGCEDETARLWDAETGAWQRTLEGHTDRVRSCAFSADGRRLVTASMDTTARLWNVAL